MAIMGVMEELTITSLAGEAAVGQVAAAVAGTDA